jgi:hypothetical protein
MTRALGGNGVPLFSVESRVADGDLRGKFLARAPRNTDYDHVVAEDSDFVDAETGRLILLFRKSVLSARAAARARAAFSDIDETESPSVSRRAAAGKLSLSKFRTLRSDLAKIIPITATSGRLLLKDGRTLRQTMSNPVHSYLAGYGVHRFEPRAVKNLLTNRYPTRWQNAVPFFQEIDRVHARLLPAVHQLQVERCRLHPSWTIPGTALSTVTININYESCYHWDTGDFADGYSTLSVVEQGRYDGGYLVFPKYRLAVDVRERDLLLCQSHIDIHGNTKMSGSKNRKRVSFVTYLKHKLAETENRLEQPDRTEERKVS